MNLINEEDEMELDIEQIFTPLGSERPERPEKPEKLEQDLIQRALDIGKHNERKFTDDDIAVDPLLVLGAEDWLKEYNGDFEFLKDVKKAQFKFGRLTNAQARAVLNCMLADKRHTGVVEAPTLTNSTPAVTDGIYTIVLTSSEDYVTIRLERFKRHQDPTDLHATTYTGVQYKPLPEGTQVASYLKGPVNTIDFEGFAWVSGKQVSVWRRFQMQSRLTQALEVLLKMEEPDKAGEAYSLRSNRCYICGRELTVPSSICKGIGPICAGRQ